MKKKSRTYLLLGLVLAIWGILGFRLVRTLNPPEGPMEPFESMSLDIPIKIKKRDTFSISANYRDPFLGTMPESYETPKTTKKKLPTIPKREVTYLGTVGENGTKNALFFVGIDGQQHIMSRKQSIDGVQLLTGSSREIKVRYAGRTETIKRTQ